MPTLAPELDAELAAPLTDLTDLADDLFDIDVRIEVDTTRPEAGFTSISCSSCLQSMCWC
ncbi:FDLD family class I lanthipeptide [Streptomyces sp. NPDC098789]|uniref:FDLD family class I lanthipeptide n=1 Tax=Streptomyces sp. NPDC098789 TaxID=3366098 RepID=UPI00380CC1BF